MKELDAGAGGGPRQPDQRPACVARRVRRFADVFDTGGDGTGVTAERDDLQRLAERGQRADQFGRVPADSRGWRCEGAAIESDSECAGIQSSKCKVQTINNSKRQCESDACSDVVREYGPQRLRDTEKYFISASLCL